MKNTLKHILSLFITITTLSGCFSTSPNITQTITPTIYASSTSENSVTVVSTAILLPDITPPPTQYFPPLLTPRVTPFPTITLAEATENLMYMLKTNGDCKFPCFWGIHPDLTRYEELYIVIDNLGGYRFESLQENGAIRIGSNFRFEQNNQIFVEFQAELQDDIVKDLKVKMGNLRDTGLTPEDWSAYNMDKILKDYGIPSKVELYYSGPYNSLSFHIQLKYESIDTFIIYSARTNETARYETPTSIIFCLNEIGVDKVQLHMGKTPFDTIPDGVSLLEATGLNAQDFHKLFTENPSACLTLNREAMP